jgi:hypothetical protein
MTLACQLLSFVINYLIVTAQAVQISAQTSGVDETKGKSVLNHWSSGSKQSG